MGHVVTPDGASAAGKPDGAPLTEDTRLQRKAAAAALTAAGYPVSAATLDSLVTRGGGPPYVLFGKHAIYRWGDLLEWARPRDRKPGQPAPVAHRTSPTQAA